jgi:hypothetical protein
MAVIDDDYVKNANDLTAVVGRKIKISQDEVIAALGLIEEMGRRQRPRSGEWVGGRTRQIAAVPGANAAQVPKADAIDGE